MKIQIGNIVINHTKKYLAPCLKAYGKEFEERLHDVFKVGIGIGDIILMRSNITLEKHIFILIDTERQTLSPNKTFVEFLQWIRGQEMFEDDYVHDNVRTGHLHMIVVKLPPAYHATHETFKKSLYSKMFTPEDLINFFNSQPDLVKVLVKDSGYRVKFVQKINATYGTDLNEQDLQPDQELDFPLQIDNEIFNSHLNRK